ncbi:MAG: hypothetical protein JWP91_4216 [Fibrobacteres bacterium]|nr:hypothetical protein [Fibrobacterota bacterium]
MNFFRARPHRLRGAAEAFCAIAFILFASCDRDPDRLAGGWTDTDTGSKVTGIIFRGDGKPAASSLVVLRPEDYLAKDPSGSGSGWGSASMGSILDGQCDSLGRFAFDSVRAGHYSLEARDREIKGALIRFQAAGEGVGMDLNGVTVRALGRITGYVNFSDSLPGPVLVRIFGLERAAMADPVSGRFDFGDIPPGEYTLRFSGLEPFVPSEDKYGIRVSPDSLTDAGRTLLRRGLKQDFRMVDGMMEIPGVDSTNPVVYENGAFFNPVDGAYLWAKASMGRLDLRGVLVSYGKDTGEAAVEENRRSCLGLMRLARLSGMHSIPDPVLGARAKLKRPASGNLADIHPDSSEGSRMLIDQARKASREKPLLVISGANLTTVACALLLDPLIADRMIVLATNNGNFNKEDSLALAVVSRKARLVEWARDFTWADARLPAATDSPRLSNRYGERLKAYLESNKDPYFWALGFYADFGAPTFLFQRKVWRGAVAADWVAPPMAAAAVPDAASGKPFDFVDVPLSATDWNAIQAEFFSTINDPGAYHPWPLKEGILAEAYAADSGVSVSPGLDGSGEALIWPGPGTWAEYDVTADSSGTYALDFRYQAAEASSLRVMDTGSGASARIGFPAGSGWNTVTASLPLLPGSRRIRIDCMEGSVTLDWIHPHVP